MTRILPRLRSRWRAGVTLAEMRRLAPSRASLLSLALARIDARLLAADFDLPAVGGGGYSLGDFAGGWLLLVFHRHLA